MDLFIDGVMGFNFLKATEPLQRDSLLFTIKSPGSSDTHLINLVATDWFWTGDHWIGNPAS